MWIMVESIEHPPWRRPEPIGSDHRPLRLGRTPWETTELRAILSEPQWFLRSRWVDGPVARCQIQRWNQTRASHSDLVSRASVQIGQNQAKATSARTV